MRSSLAQDAAKLAAQLTMQSPAEEWQLLEEFKAQMTDAEWHEYSVLISTIADLRKSVEAS